MIRFSSLVVVTALLLSACSVGPEYSRPEGNLPTSFRASAAESESPDGRSLGDLAWFEVFKDEALQDLIHRAIESNRDLAIAAERVIESRAFVTIAGSERWPTVTAGAAGLGQRFSAASINPVVKDRTRGEFLLSADLNWEIDFWGRIASATEAARADMLAAEENRNLVMQSVVTEVALAYVELRELDLELEISRRTLESRKSSLKLVSARQSQGVASMLEVRQAEVLVSTAAVSIPQIESSIERNENRIRVLLGEFPGSVRRGDALTANFEIEIPAGLPARLLERRPDIRAAEMDLVAANARIGEARALLYPTISLTGSAGFESEALRNLFDERAAIWNIVGSLMAPIFNAGRIEAQVEINESRQRQLVESYLGTIEIAFREVSDALVGYRKGRERRHEQQMLTETLADQKRLSDLRYRGGVTSYLEVLDTERQYFEAELELARAYRDEILWIIALYRALGGGWEPALEADSPVMTEASGS